MNCASGVMSFLMIFMGLICGEFDSATLCMIASALFMIANRIGEKK